MNNFSISYQLTLKEYRQLTFKLLYRVPFIILSIFSVIFILTLPLLYNDKNNPLNNINDFLLFLSGVLTIFLSTITPLLAWSRTKLDYKSNCKLHELITYNISNEGIAVIGKSFNAKYSWEHVYCTKIIKGWLLIYQSRTAANLIKISVEDQENIEALKHFLKTSNFKMKLDW